MHRSRSVPPPPPVVSTQDVLPPPPPAVSPSVIAPPPPVVADRSLVPFRLAQMMTIGATCLATGILIGGTLITTTPSQEWIASRSANDPSPNISNEETIEENVGEERAGDVSTNLDAANEASVDAVIADSAADQTNPAAPKDAVAIAIVAQVPTTVPKDVSIVSDDLAAAVDANTSADDSDQQSVQVAADSAAATFDPVVATTGGAPVTAAAETFTGLGTPTAASPLQCEDGTCSTDLDSHGTALKWAKSPADAYRTAGQQNKLVFLIHVSGNFEIPGFT